MKDDLERDLGEMLKGKAEDSFAHVGEGRMPADTTKRVRRRQTRTVVSAGVLLTATGGLLWLGAVMIRNNARDVAPADGKATREVVVVERGTGADRWRFLVSTEDGEWCFNTTQGRSGGGACGFGVPPRPLGVASGTTPDGGWAVYGPIIREVSAVTLLPDGGGTSLRAQIFELPSLPFDVYLLPLQGEVTGRLVAHNAQGGEIAHETLRAGPSAVDEFIEVFDTYTNVVGYVSTAMPSPPPIAFGKQLCSPELPPGIPIGQSGKSRGTIELVRAFACVQLEHVPVEVRAWWKSRPWSGAPDSRFEDWWNAYPWQRNGLSTDHPGASVDIYENVWAYLAPGQADGPLLGGASPGAGGVPIKTIRHNASRHAIRLWKTVKPWWEARPKPEAPDQAFLDWWAAYPVEGAQNET